MTKNEFMKHIENAHYKLDRDYLYSGCCCSLVDLEVPNLFKNMLKPSNLDGSSCNGIDGYNAYWLGNLTKENLPLRHHFIDMFAGIILADEGYKDLKKYYDEEGWLK